MHLLASIVLTAAVAYLISLLVNRVCERREREELRLQVERMRSRPAIHGAITRFDRFSRSH